MWLVFLGEGRQGSQLIQNPVSFLPPSSTGRDRFLTTAQQAAKLSGEAKRWAEPEQGQWAGPGPAPRVRSAASRTHAALLPKLQRAERTGQKGEGPGNRRKGRPLRVGCPDPQGASLEPEEAPLFEVGRSDASILQSHPGSLLTPSGLRPLSPSIPNVLDVLHFVGGTRPNPAPRAPSPAQVKTLHALRSVWRVAG